MRKALVRLDGRKAGTLEETEEGFFFQYFPEYLGSPSPSPVSLTLPFRKEPYQSTALFPFFDGLIPEGWMLEVLSSRFGILPSDRFALLLKAGKNVVGNVSVEEPSDGN